MIRSGRCPKCSHVDYGLGGLRREALLGLSRPRGVRSGRRVPRAGGGRPAGGIRGRRTVSSRSARPPAWTKQNNSFVVRASRRILAAGETPAHKLNRVIHPMSYSSQHLKETVQIISGSTRKCSNKWPPPWPTFARAAAGCSFWASAAARPTARTPSTTSANSAASKPIPADRQRLGIDRPSQRRRLGYRLRRMAARQPADGQGHGVCSFPWAAATGKRTSASA